MNTLPVLVSAVVASAVTAAVVTFAFRPDPAPPPAAPGTELAERVASLETDLERLRTELRTMRSSEPVRHDLAPPIDPAVIDAAIARHLAARDAGGDATAAAPNTLTRNAAIARLDAVGGDYDQIEEVWKEISAADLEDEVLEHFKALAEAAPDDAQAQYRYGAYLIAGIEDEPMSKQSEMAIAADAAFDRTLELDGEHWAARFLKATSLSFWPKITGKHVEAVEHFRTLVEQQERRAPEPHFVHTYVFLGNMLADQGDAEGARAAYERGRRLFPDNEDLKRQLAALER